MATDPKNTFPQPAQQEPVAWIVEDQSGERLEWAGDAHSCHGVPTFPLYTSPQAQRKPLTDEETKLLWHKARLCIGPRWMVFKRLVEAAHGIKEQPAPVAEPRKQEPVALKWQQSPIRTAWGDDMVVASVAIDNDHTLSLYCERDQTPKVDAMFAQRTWVGLTNQERGNVIDNSLTPACVVLATEAKLKEKNT